MSNRHTNCTTVILLFLPVWWTVFTFYIWELLGNFLLICWVQSCMPSFSFVWVGHFFLFSFYKICLSWRFKFRILKNLILFPILKFHWIVAWFYENSWYFSRVWKNSWHFYWLCAIWKVRICGITGDL